MIIKRREITADHLKQIIQIIAENWDQGIGLIARKVCLAWKWKNKQGELHQKKCILLLKSLQSKGYIKLPLEVVVKINKRNITHENIRLIAQIIAKNWNKGFDSIARKICIAWKWKRRGGGWQDKECRMLLRNLKRRGYVQLPFELKFRGRLITESDANFIKDIIRKNQGKGRVHLSKEICIAWNWTQKNGFYQDQVCRTLLVALEKIGHISLPPKKKDPPNNAVKRDTVKLAGFDLGQEEIELRQEVAFRIEQVRREPWEKTFNGLLERFHHQGYRQSPGAHLKYVVFVEKIPIACASFCSAPRFANGHTAYPDRSGNNGDRRLFIHNIICNDRFLILPWVKANGCTGRLLSSIEAKVIRDWKLYYHWGVKAIEAYVDGEDEAEPYRQAGWTHMGEILGIDKMKKKPLHAPKEVYVKIIEDSANELQAVG